MPVTVARMEAHVPSAQPTPTKTSLVMLIAKTALCIQLPPPAATTSRIAFAILVIFPRAMVLVVVIVLQALNQILKQTFVWGVETESTSQRPETNLVRNVRITRHTAYTIKLALQPVYANTALFPTLILIYVKRVKMESLITMQEKRNALTALQILQGRVLHQMTAQCHARTFARHQPDIKLRPVAQTWKSAPPTPTTTAPTQRARRVPSAQL